MQRDTRRCIELRVLTDVYFEAGDHDDVVHMSGEAFLDLLSGSLHGRFSSALTAEPER